MNEQKKYEVIKGLADHPDTANKNRAAMVLGCTRRHINRMLQGYIKSGKKFFLHGNKGKKPATTISHDIRRQVIDLYRTKYYDANFEHYTELLKKNEGICISHSSVMNILE
ncbi:MAG: transposase, partial [Lachnoanaerobaculum sp.]|nr:transposase [Lachnoanaerobaculum sp.]